MIGALLLGFSPGRTHAADPVTVVQKPLMNRPALVLPGASFALECAASSSASGWTVRLAMPYHETADLAVTVGSFSNGIQHLEATVPAGTPFELYDLVVQAPSGETDRVTHSVRVLPAYKSTFYFVHLPDCHLPAVSWVGFYDDDNTVPEYLQILDEIALINPEFILQTGDLVDNGQNDAQYAQAQELTEGCQAPMFITGGNHDLWYDGHDLWHRYFGTTMDYSFLYGDVRFLGLEMYDIPSKTYTAAQMTWLRSTLDQSIANNEAGRILFTHYDESRQITGTFVDQYHVDGLFYGHTHLNGETTLGLRQAPKVNTSFTMNDNGEYRLVKVVNGQVTDYPLIKFRQIRANIAPANDGSAWSMQAEIFNDTDVDLEGVRVKLHLNGSAAPVAVQGDILQHIAYDGGSKTVVYMTTDVAAHSSATVEVNNGGSGTVPVMTTYSPTLDTTIYGGQTLNLSAASDAALDFVWTLDGAEVQSQNSVTTSTYAFQPAVDFEGQAEIVVTAGDGSLVDEQAWTVYVKKSTGKPELVSAARNFFPHNEALELEWIEPVAGSGTLEYGLIPGQTLGSVQEDGISNTVSFVPEDEGMGLGIYFCRIKSGGLVSDEFPIVIESPQAPQMIGPVGNIETLKPVFQWEAVQGVPFYFVILTDQEVILTEDEEGNYSLEGANPIWAVLTSETSVPYGVPDPSGTFTSFPAPLTRGQAYWWVVLNCYGNAPELTSTVQSGVSRFKVDLPLPDLAAPELIAPADSATVDGAQITFRWSAVEGAIGYNFYPYKIEIEEGIEVVRPVWETVMTTTNTRIEYEAAQLMAKGRYRWRVAALDADGTESPSAVRNFTYDAPFASLKIYTRDSRGTVATSDDKVLPRVSVNYDAISGVDMGLPLSTDDSGNRTDLVFTPGRYSFTATKDGFEPTTVELDLLDATTQTQAQSIVFRMNPDPATLSGQVVDDAGKAVAAAKIFAQHSLHADITRQASAAQNGDFSLSLAPGPWQVTASKAGYQASAVRSVSLAIGDVLALESPLVVEKNQNTIQGSVVNTAGRPVYGARVTLQAVAQTLDQSTDADGLFSFAVGDGSYTLSVSKSGFTPPAARSITVSGGAIHTVSPNLVLTPANAMITGTVSDGKRAVGAATVKATPSSGVVITTQSDGYGQYSLSLNAGSYVLTAEKAGYSTGPARAISTAPGETVSGVGLTLSPNSGSISGLVTTDGFAPLSDVSITVDGMQATSDAAGRYTVSMAAGAYTVTAARSGYLASAPREVVLGPGQAVDGVDFTLSPNASVISGRVTFDGSGVAAARVVAVNGITVETSTDDNGYYSLSVEAGDYQLHAVKSGFISPTIDVAVGQAQNLDGRNIALTRNISTVSGVITEAGSTEPVMNARVQVAGTAVSTTSKSDGSYLLELEPAAGGVEITVSRSGYVSMTQSSGALIAGETAVVSFELQASSTLLSGMVRDEDDVPVGGVAVAADLNGTVYQAETTADGAFALALAPDGGTYTVTAAKHGYLFPDASKSVVLQANEKLTGYDLEIHRNFGRIKGRITAQGTGSAIAQADVSLSLGDSLVATVFTDEAGDYDFVAGDGQAYLPAQSYTLKAEKAGFADTTRSSVVLAGGAVLTENLVLRKFGEHISGTVTDGSVAVADVTVSATHESSGARSSQITGADGSFRFDALSAGDYRLTASKAGYTAAASPTVTATQEDVSLTLSANTGRIRGRVTERGTAVSISSASVALSDGHGNELSVQSAASGVYSTVASRLLPTVYPYDITVRRSGFADTTATAISAASVDSTHFVMRRLYGSVTGRILSFTDSTAMNEIVVTLKNGAQVYTDTTDTTGVYGFIDLPAASYSMTVDEPGYLSSPASQTLNLWSGPSLADIDVYLESVELTELSITGPVLVRSGGVAQFSYAAKTADGRQMGVDPQWAVDVEGAVDSVTADGFIYPKADFIGPLWIRLTDGHTDFTDSLQIHVTAIIEPEDGARVLQDYRGGLFALDTASVVQPIAFSVKYPAVPQVKKVLRHYLVAGDVYALQPAYLILNRPMTVTLPLSVTLSAAKSVAGQAAPSMAAVDIEDIRLGMWDANRLEWKIRQGTPGTGNLAISSDTLAQWTVMIPTQKLGVRAFTAQPNPFSPVLGPMEIAFTLTSHSATYLAVNAKIYNMNGRLVRTLLEDEQIIKDQPYTLEWDGVTDYGRNALNGRYLLHIEARDGKETTRLLKSLVLVK